MKTFNTFLSVDDAKDMMRSLSVSGLIDYIDHMSTLCHAQAVACGWYQDPETGENQARNFGEVIALIHSELSEALEGARKDLASDKIPNFSAIEEEFADTLIRLFDTAGALQLQLGDAFVAKLKYNRTREDHKLSARRAGGKQF